MNLNAQHQNEEDWRKDESAAGLFNSPLNGGHWSTWPDVWPTRQPVSFQRQHSLKTNSGSDSCKYELKIMFKFNYTGFYCENAIHWSRFEDSSNTECGASSRSERAVGGLVACAVSGPYLHVGCIREHADQPKGLCREMAHR